MTDLSLRQHQRHGTMTPALLRGLMRAGRLTLRPEAYAALVGERYGKTLGSFVEVRDVACPERYKPGWCAPTSSGEHACPICNGTGTIPYDSWDVVNLLAYLGDASARELGDVCPCPGFRTEDGGGWGWHRFVEHDSDTLESWLSGLARLAAKLPPVRVEAECRGSHVGHARSCDCNGTGKTHHDTPADRWLMVVAAHAVAEAVLPVWRKRHDVEDCPAAPPGSWGICDCNQRVTAALDACATWIACPCRGDCFVKCMAAYTGGLPWVDGIIGEISGNGQNGRVTQTAADAIQAAAEILTPQRVREVAAKEVRGSLGV